jgi:hypothetical protein
VHICSMDSHVASCYVTFWVQNMCIAVLAVTMCIILGLDVIISLSTVKPVSVRGEGEEGIN